jgi:hypothetical protein
MESMNLSYWWLPHNIYGVNPKSKQLASSTSKFFGDLAIFNKELNSQRKDFQDSGHAVHGSALQEVEQEREVTYEVENVREVQKPVYFQPFSFPGLHRDLVSYVKTGRMAADSAAYEYAFSLLRRTSLGREHRVSNDGTSCSEFLSNNVPILIRHFNSWGAPSPTANSPSFHRTLCINRVHQDC